MHVIGPVLSIASHLLQSSHQKPAVEAGHFNDTLLMEGKATSAQATDADIKQLSTHLTDYARAMYPDEPSGNFQLRANGGRYEVLTPSGRVVTLEPGSMQEAAARCLDDLNVGVRLGSNKGNVGWMMMLG